MEAPVQKHILSEKKRLSDPDFRKVSNFITSEYGIKLPDFKKIMVEGRLQKRLKATNISSFSKYVEWVFSVEGAQERLEMIDAISTNKTDFFRESFHFDFLTKTLLPSICDRNSRFDKLKIWSSASSSGEELYTIAMVMEEFNRQQKKGKIDYSILGTDISIEKLKAGISGVYPYDRISHLSTDLRNRYFLRHKDEKVNTVRVIPGLRSKVEFQRVNLMQAHYPVEKDMDIIFCRNVLIYFDKSTQEKVINKLCEKLKPGGHFFLGHSESTIGKEVPLKQLLPTIYKKV